jgi:hypothetical protein
MQHILGISRYQMRISSLENAISTDNQVRFMDAFVESLELFITLMAFMNIKKKHKVARLCRAENETTQFRFGIAVS